MSYTKKNIIWIVIDTLRSDMLASCKSEVAKPNEIDNILEQGVLFTDVMTTGGGTRISAPSYFTSLRPGLTGMAHMAVDTLRNLNDDAISVTEHFKHHGYRTLRWDDSSLDSCQPKSGFEIFESGYPTLDHTPDRDYDNSRRDAFVKRLRKDNQPFFAYLHLDFIHDFGGYSRNNWSTEQYLDIVAQQAKDFQKLWDKLNPGFDDIVVISSDHGCILDRDYIEYDKKKPWDFSNARTQVFASFIAEGLVPCKRHNLIRSIDIAPTLLDMALGEEMHAQGVCLTSVLHGGPELDLIGIAERNVTLEKKSIADYTCLRKSNWTYFINSQKPFMLFNSEDGDLNVDHLGKGFEVEKELHQYYEDFVVNGWQTPTDLYKQHGLSIPVVRGEPDISILLPVCNWSDDVRLCLDSLLDQILFTELILLDADSSGEVAEKLAEQYSDRMYLRHIQVQVNEKSLCEMLNIGLEKAKGVYCVTATPLCQYTENFCYSLHKEFLKDSNVVLAYANSKRLISDNREMGYLGTDECFDEILFSRMGSGFDHNSSSKILSLPYFNEIGACAMFRTETMRNSRGFVENLGKTWHKLIKIGTIKHVRKGLTISKDSSILRPVMPWREEQSRFKISVIIPVLESNVLHKLPQVMSMLSTQCVDSMEVLLLYSAENTSFLKAVAKDFSKLKIKIVKHSGLLYKLLNTGLYVSRGEFLFWLDPADKLLPKCIGSMIDHMDQDQDVTALRCGVILTEQGKPKQVVVPHRHTREMIQEVCDLRGLLYKRRLHNDIGVFTPSTGNEFGWDLCIKLSLVSSFQIIEEPMIIATRMHQYFIQSAIESYRKVMRNMINAMGGMVDFVRLYEDDFRRHSAGKARYILEEEMLLILKLINKLGICAGGLIRVPKIY
ncbi:sulfatase-like hydrolase/transferase [Desulfovibrio sp. UCD-KL4C]|uniref:sulfatase-like hydrolase/transferase n=1 Tax=Desulfovibrio sp. UCD-KL4C TaxID=2578120 RepID=UPI0025C611E1|nr:sulfatase-like hydrolase/transferase [Desulfovibrio sp. UCD-KL4C]